MELQSGVWSTLCDHVRLDRVREVKPLRIMTNLLVLWVPLMTESFDGLVVDGRDMDFKCLAVIYEMNGLGVGVEGVVL